MKIKTTMAAFILLLSPAAAFAYCNGGAHTEQQAAISCAEGLVFDAESQTCVAETTS